MHKLIGTLFLTTVCCLSLFGNVFFNNLTVEILELENVECFGEDSGYVELTASNGTAPYTFNLDGEINNLGIFEALTVGNYTVVVTDQTGCSTTFDFEIEEPEVLAVTIVSLNDTECATSTNGSFQLATSGGNGGYFYTLGNEVNTTGLFENLPAGIYQPIIEDIQGCEMSIMVVINESAGISASIVEQINVDCFGNSTGVVQLEAVDGILPYQYAIGADINTSGIFSNLSAGIYSVLITDAVGCTVTQNVTITEPALLTAAAAQMTNVSCFGANDGSFQVTANGGTQGYTFATMNDNNADGVFTNQVAGTFAVTVTDASGCTATTSVTIAEPSEIIVDNPIVNNVDCFGNTTGSIQVSASGGAGGFTYSVGNQTNTTGIFAGLGAGDYTVLITDAGNCGTTLGATIAQPSELVGTIDAIFNINCSGGGTGAVDFGATGGTPDFTFILNGVSNDDGFFENLTAGSYTAIIVDANNCETTVTAVIEESTGLGVNILSLNDVTCSGDTDGLIVLEANGGSGNYTYTLNGEVNTTGEFSNLASGDYAVFVSDDLDCSTTVDFTISEPMALTVSVALITSIACAGDNNAAIQATAIGGNGDFNYSIGLQNNTTGLFENLPEGTYSVLVSDANGCTAVEEIIIEEPTPLQILIPGFEAVSCSGGSDGFIQAMGLGGTGNYTYALNDETNTSGLFEMLPFGIYDIQVVDENGCVASTQFTVSVPNEVFGVIAEIQDAGCNMMLGFVQIEGNGGTGAFNYTLGMETNTTGFFGGFQAGTYEVILSDANGCTGTIEFSISDSEDISAMVVEQADAECFGEASGFVQISATGGGGVITYTLGGMSNETGIFENVTGGIYDVEVSSPGGCTVILPVVIEEPEILSTTVGIIQSPLCAGNEDGMIQITATGGTGAYTYTFNGETNTTGLFENLAGGTYEVVVGDENECMVSSTFTLAAPVVLNLTILNIQPDNGSDNGSFNVQGSGGVSPYQFSLDGVTFQTAPPFSNLMFGDYTAYIMDANGCIALAEVTVPFNSNTYSLESGVADMTVFPNPFVEKLTIELDLYRGQTLNFTMFSINGLKINQTTETFAAGKSNLSFDALENLSAGTYFLRVVGTDFQGYFKVVKQ